MVTPPSGHGQPADGAPDVPMVPFSELYGGHNAFSSTSKPPPVQHYLPFTATLEGYGRSRLQTDVVAGLTVAALALPASMAYAQLAGLPITAGLYSLLLPVVAYALLGSTRWLVVGPEGTIALLIASGLAPLAVAGSSEYTTLAATLAVLVGVVFVAARWLHLGWIADYFSQAVLVGYISGVAIVIILSQFGKLFGLSSDQSNAVLALVDMVSQLGHANPATVAVALVSLVLLFVLGRWLPRFPAALVVVVLGIVASWALDLAAHGVAITGTVPSGLPSFALPRVDGGQVAQLIGLALSIFLVSYSNSILTARSFAAQRHESVDADQELLALGVGNLAAGLTQGMPINASGARTAVNMKMRATSQVGGMVAAATIAVFLLFFTEPIQYLPAAVLGAVIVMASFSLIDAAQWRALAQSARAEVVIAAVTTLAVINVGVLRAIVAAVLLSILDIVRRLSRPHDALLGWAAAENRYADVDSHPDAGITPGVVVYRFSDRLFFANAHFFKRRVWAAVDAAPKPTSYLVLDVESVPGVDASAASALRELHEGLARRNVTLEIARATDGLEAVLRRFGLVDLIGPQHFHATVTAAVESVGRSRS
ncbi:MAG: SulP family inorganic anion transporter [Actinomycetes bacterium]